MFTPVNISFTNVKVGCKGCKLYGRVSMIKSSNDRNNTMKCVPSEFQNQHVRTPILNKLFAARMKTFLSLVTNEKKCLTCRIARHGSKR